MKNPSKACQPAQPLEVKKITMADMARPTQATVAEQIERFNKNDCKTKLVRNDATVLPNLLKLYDHLYEMFEWAGSASEISNGLLILFAQSIGMEEPDHVQDGSGHEKITADTEVTYFPHFANKSFFKIRMLIKSLTDAEALVDSIAIK